MFLAGVLRALRIYINFIKEKNLEEFLYSSVFYQAPLVASFLAGVITFLSPCILPLIPAYISYISGISLEHITQNPTKHRTKIILTSLSFIAGFCVVFVVLGIFVDILLSEVLNSAVFRIVSGMVVIGFGLHFLGIFRLSFLYKLHLGLNITPPKGKVLSIFAPFLLGVSFSACWSPCAGPILASILALGALKDNEALHLMLAYSFGLGLAFFITALLIDCSLGFLARLKSFIRAIEVVCGILLIVLGVLILSEKIDEVVGVLMNL